MEYLKDNYLPTPNDIIVGQEFCMSYNNDEEQINETVIELGDPANSSSMYNSWFIEHLEVLGLRKDIDTDSTFADLALSFLHELGHVATLGSLSAQERKESRLLQICCAFAFQEKITKVMDKIFSSEYNQVIHNNAFAYWYSPTERLAQEWVVNMLNLFPKMLDDLTDIFDRHYDELFYIEEDEE